MRTILLISVEAASGWGRGPGSTTATLIAARVEFEGGRCAKDARADDQDVIGGILHG